MEQLLLQSSIRQDRWQARHGFWHLGSRTNLREHDARQRILLIFPEIGELFQLLHGGDLCYLMAKRRDLAQANSGGQ